MVNIVPLGVAQELHPFILSHNARICIGFVLFTLFQSQRSCPYHEGYSKKKKKRKNVVRKVDFRAFMFFNKNFTFFFLVVGRGMFSHGPPLPLH